jgi:hypothetical protein
MKTSNILIITYFSVIFGGLAVLCYDDMRHFAKIKPKSTQVEKQYESKMDLPKFTVIFAVDCRFSVTSGESNQLAVVDKVRETPLEICNVRNDTLFMNGILKGVNHVTIVCKDIKTITAQKSNINMYNSEIGTLNLDLDNSLFQAYNTKIKIVNGKLRDSRFKTFYSKIRRFNIEQLEDKEYNVSIEQ